MLLLPSWYPDLPYPRARPTRSHPPQELEEGEVKEALAGTHLKPATNKNVNPSGGI